MVLMNFANTIKEEDLINKLIAEDTSGVDSKENVKLIKYDNNSKSTYVINGYLNPLGIIQVVKGLIQKFYN